MPRKQSVSVSSQSVADQTLPPVVELWLHRLLITLGGHREFVMTHGFGHDRLAEVIGLGHWLEETRFEFEPKKVYVELRQLARKCEKNHRDFSLPTPLQQNIDSLAKLIGLSETDSRILAFAVLVNSYEVLDNAADCIGRISSNELFRVLAVLLDTPESEIRQALSQEGLLATSGLLSLQRSGVSNMRSSFEWLSFTFADNLFSADSDPVVMLRDVINPAPSPELKWQDYDHVAESMAVLSTYMNKVTSLRRKGINIFIHGRPGTGKTQLARVLASHLKLELFEIATSDDDGDSVSGMQRLRAFRAAQCFFSSRDALLVYDEAEDVLNDYHDIFERPRGQSRKAWLNRSLEDNPVPVLWLSNSAEGIDPAIIRRFDMVIELPIPSRKHRYRILEQYCSALLSPEEISSLSDSDALSPAVAQSAASVTALVKDELETQDAGKIFRNLVNNTLQAQGYKSLDYSYCTPLPKLYDPALLNCDTPLMKIAQGIKRAGSARLCLYGPPGTGKTAYAQWLARELDTPLIVKRASDLISMYVGQTEKLIAAAFAQARDEQAVLLIDEVDSFLQDRRNARASWDVTMVNEMLTQLETFEGVFIASTNLMDNLDQAVLRRFDLKLRFNYLESAQAQELTTRYCNYLKLGLPTKSDLASIAAFMNLTPGDFATAVRQHQFSPFNSPKEFIDGLAAECGVKEKTQRPIGFVH